MKSITIPKGSEVSNSFVLGHWKIGAVFIPATPETNYWIGILGSHDGKDFGSVNGNLGLFTQPRYSVQTFDPEIFAGIQFLKLEMDRPAPKDLEFFLHIEDS